MKNQLRCAEQDSNPLHLDLPNGSTHWAIRAYKWGDIISLLTAGEVVSLSLRLTIPLARHHALAPILFNPESP